MRIYSWTIFLTGYLKTCDFQNGPVSTCFWVGNWEVDRTKRDPYQKLGGWLLHSAFKRYQFFNSTEFSDLDLWVFWEYIYIYINIYVYIIGLPGRTEDECIHDRVDGSGVKEIWRLVLYSQVQDFSIYISIGNQTQNFHPPINVAK